MYKIGRTNNPKLRFAAYEKGGEQKLLYPCVDDVVCERELKQIFNKKFILREDYGKEYYEGPLFVYYSNINK